MEKVNWSKYFKLPLKEDGGGYSSYAWTDDGQMALDFDRDITLDESRVIIDVINGITKSPFETITVDDIEFFLDGKYIFCIRGWGNLTGIGGHRFSSKKAAQIQDGFRDFIYSQLRNE